MGYASNKLWERGQVRFSIIHLWIKSADFPVDKYRDSLQFLFSLSLWVGKNLPIGIEMDTQALLPATKTFKRASIKQS